MTEQMTDSKNDTRSEADNTDLTYSRREAMAALAKYAGAVGGAATVILTADGLVHEAAASGNGRGNGGSNTGNCPASNPNC